MGFPDASTLESVEVMKGSSALLYGNVSGGLIINMVTKKPRFDWGGQASILFGSYNQYKPTLDVYGPISKNLAFRVVGTYENAKRDEARYQSSFQTGGVTQQQLDQAKLATKNAKLRLQASQRRLSDANIKSPINGIVNKKMIEVGAVVAPGTQLFELVDVS